MKIYIKNMVCQGTKKYVLHEVKKLGLNLKSLDAGELEFQHDLSPAQQAALEFRLAKYGLETGATTFSKVFQTASIPALAV
jgi:hypothetical protein